MAYTIWLKVAVGYRQRWPKVAISGAPRGAAGSGDAAQAGPAGVSGDAWAYGVMAHRSEAGRQMTASPNATSSGTPSDHVGIAYRSPGGAGLQPAARRALVGRSTMPRLQATTSSVSGRPYSVVEPASGPGSHSPGPRSTTTSPVPARP